MKKKSICEMITEQQRFDNFEYSTLGHPTNFSALSKDSIMEYLPKNTTVLIQSLGILSTPNSSTTYN